MKVLHLIFAILLATITLSSCVAKKKFTAAEQARLDCLDREKIYLNSIDSLQNVMSGLTKDTSVLGSELRNLNADYLNLNQAKQNLETTSSTELNKLNQQLQKKSTELTEKERILQEREKKVQELQAILGKQQQMVDQLRTTVQRALTGFKSDELSVEMRNGKVYVSLSEKLLFQSGSATVDPKGAEAIKKLADVLKKNTDFDIMVEGHTDNVPLKPGRFDDNWDLSASRALSIVRILTADNGVEPKRIIAAGRSEYIPVATNTTTEGKAKNRRTEIILSPKLDELYKLIESSR